jgi:hypothetical protein
LALSLTWQAHAAPGRSLQVFAQAWLAGEIVAQADGPLGTELYPSAWWPPAAIVRETRWLALPAGAAGVTVRIGLYDPVSLTRFARTDPGASSQRDYVEVMPED